MFVLFCLAQFYGRLFIIIYLWLIINLFIFGENEAPIFLAFTCNFRLPWQNHIGHIGVLVPLRQHSLWVFWLLSICYLLSVAVHSLILEVDASVSLAILLPKYVKSSRQALPDSSLTNGCLYQLMLIFCQHLTINVSDCVEAAVSVDLIVLEVEHRAYIFTVFDGSHHVLFLIASRIESSFSVLHDFLVKLDVTHAIHLQEGGSILEIEATVLSSNTLPCKCFSNTPIYIDIDQHI